MDTISLCRFQLSFRVARIVWRTRSSCCGSAVTNLTSIHDMGSIPDLSRGLRIQHCHSYGVGHRHGLDPGAVIAAQAGGYSSDVTPSLETSGRCRCRHKKPKKKKKKNCVQNDIFEEIPFKIISEDIIYMWNLKYVTNEPIQRIERDSQTWGTDMYITGSFCCIAEIDRTL